MQLVLILMLILILRYDDTINGTSVIQRPQLVAMVCSCAKSMLRRYLCVYGLLISILLS